MELFNLLFPDVPPYSINVSKSPLLPDGSYAFLERYCPNPKCDCQEGLFHMVKVDPQSEFSGTSIADIDYHWGGKYSNKNPKIRKGTEQSDAAREGLKRFQDSLQNELGLVDSFKAHYKMLKDYFIQHPDELLIEDEELLIENNDKLMTKTGPKVGRNAPCPCGSGKKYKKCCL